MKISAMTRSDLNDIVELHVRSFPGFFLSHMGCRFLYCLYDEILSDPTGIALVSKQRDGTAGFVAGTVQPRNFYTRLLTKRWCRFALASVIPAIQNPLIFPRLLNAFRMANKESPHEASGLLMSIGVDPQTQGKGIGTALVHAFLVDCYNRGSSSVHLTTDRLQNDGVNYFYRKLGFSVSQVVVTPQHRVLNDYRIVLDQRWRSELHDDGNG